jgi:hypothetical protein
VSWIELQSRWYDTDVLNCRLCGRLIPRRVWVADVEGARLEFCSEGCEELYRRYWLPKYGAQAMLEDGDTANG